MDVGVNGEGLGGGALSQGGLGLGTGLGSGGSGLGQGLGLGGVGGGGAMMQECVHGWAVAALAAAGTALIHEDQEKTKNMGHRAGNNNNTTTTTTNNNNNNHNDSNNNTNIPGFNGNPGKLDRDGKIKLMMAVSEDPSFLGLMQGAPTPLFPLFTPLSFPFPLDFPPPFPLPLDYPPSFPFASPPFSPVKRS